MTMPMQFYMNFGLTYGAYLGYMLTRPAILHRIRTVYFYIPDEWLRNVITLVPLMCVPLWPWFLLVHLTQGLID